MSKAIHQAQTREQLRAQGSVPFSSSIPSGEMATPSPRVGSAGKEKNPNGGHSALPRGAARGATRSCCLVFFTETPVSETQTLPWPPSQCERGFYEPAKMDSPDLLRLCWNISVFAASLPQERQHSAFSLCSSAPAMNHTHMKGCSSM